MLRQCSRYGRLSPLLCSSSAAYVLSWFNKRKVVKTVTKTGGIHVYTCVDGQWLYAGAPPINILDSTIIRYQKQYGKDNVRTSSSPNEEHTIPQWKFNGKQQHANTRSAIKHAINTESNWAYRSKTLLKDSLWRKK